MDKFIVIDTETTGLDFDKSQVIQCAAIFLNDENESVFKKEWLINYEEDKFLWDEVSASIHKIDREVAKTHGISIEDFLKDLEHFVVKYYGFINFTSDLHIVGANSYFDYLMLLNIWKKTRGEEDFLFSHRNFDLGTIGYSVLGVYGLKKISEELGIKTDDEKTHNAMYDAELHYKVFKSLLNHKKL